MLICAGEVRRCEAAGGAAPVVELLCQRGWNVGMSLKKLYFYYVSMLRMSWNFS